MPAGALSWLSGAAGDAFPQMEDAIGHKGDARRMRSGLGASITQARRTTLIGLSSALFPAPVSPVPSEEMEN